MLTNPRTQIPGGIFLTDSVIDHFLRYLMPFWPEPHQCLTFETAHGFVYTETMIQGLVQLFIFQALGELVSKFALPFIPGPVLGLVLLLLTGGGLDLLGDVDKGTLIPEAAWIIEAGDLGKSSKLRGAFEASNGANALQLRHQVLAVSAGWRRRVANWWTQTANCWPPASPPA